MGFPQTTIAFQQASGVPGELAYDGPWRSQPWQIQGGDVPNVVGATAYTVVSEGLAMPGGTGEFAGVLIMPKSYANFGGNEGGLAATMTLPDDTEAELLTMGTPFLTLTTPANIGDPIFYNTTSGALSTAPKNTTFTGAIAASSDTLTVSGTVVGALGVGSEIVGASVPPNTFIVALGSGTGGIGTYTLNNTFSAAIAAEAMSAPAIPPAGTMRVPNAKVVLRATAAGATAICELTN